MKRTFDRRLSFGPAKIVSIVILLAFIVIIAVFVNRNNNAMKPYSVNTVAMDTIVSITLYGKDAGDTVKELTTKINRLEGLFSVTDKNSEIYALNNACGESVNVSPDVANLIKGAVSLGRSTNGKLDITIYPVLKAWGFTTGDYRIPKESELQELLTHVGLENIAIKDRNISLLNGAMIDLGAVAKGYTADVLTDMLDNSKVSAAIISLGGNIQTFGNKPDNSAWQIGIKNPETDNTNLGILSLKGTNAVVTSGAYERFFAGEDGNTYGHIIDPFTGHPVESEYMSVTIVAGRGMGVLADAFSTACFMMEKEEIMKLYSEMGGFEVIAYSKNGEIYLTPGIKDFFTPEAGFKVNILN